MLARPGELKLCQLVLLSSVWCCCSVEVEPLGGAVEDALVPAGNELVPSTSLCIWACCQGPFSVFLKGGVFLRGLNVH